MTYKKIGPNNNMQEYKKNTTAPPRPPKNAHKLPCQIAKIKIMCSLKKLICALIKNIYVQYTTKLKMSNWLLSYNFSKKRTW